jgi:hypothetical protein
MWVWEATEILSNVTLFFVLKRAVTKTPKSGLHEIFRGKRVRKQFVSGLLQFKSIKITPPLYDELRTRGIGLLMIMSSVGKSNRGRKPTLTENG